MKQTQGVVLVPETHSFPIVSFLTTEKLAEYKARIAGYGAQAILWNI